MKPLSALHLCSDSAGLQPVLRAYGARDYTPQWIVRHKRSELANAPPPSFVWPAVNIIREISTFLCAEGTLQALYSVVGGVLCFFLACAAYALSGYVPWLTGASVILMLLAGALVFFAVVMECLSQLFWQIGKIKIRPPACWQAVSPGKFGLDNLPPLARQLINGAQMMWPDVPVTVHVLKQDKQILDPILQIDGHYVLVWDKDGNTVEPN